ncbi:DUF6292 family protein [Pseudonocardia spinosispora]|uniref:DUF6292 family protein n=1 Tax=Pseudonocardia spinosispora TaxID=103441 RepID=UPI000400CCA7|nr:DUF6292 family protein [Pseudonocardia spinosispora]
MSTPTRVPRSRQPVLPPSESVDDRSIPNQRSRAIPRPAQTTQPVDSEEHILVLGYVSAVAYRLNQRGFMARQLHAQPSESRALWGELTLHRGDVPSDEWAPARLRWDQNTGWSATLLPGGLDGDERLAVSRYLPAQLVAAPDTVAHFVAALHADSNTVWASSSLRPPRRADRRLLVLQLARFALPEPW